MRGADLHLTEAERADLVERGRAPRRPRRRSRRGDGLRVPLRPAARPVLDRLQRHRTAGSMRRSTMRWRRRRASPASSPSRPARVPPRALVQARTIADADRQRARAAVVERVDVRVLHAAARHARLPRDAARRDLPRRSSLGRCTTAPARGCRGGSPSRRTTPRIWSGTISTARSASPGWVSSGAWLTIW